MQRYTHPIYSQYLQIALRKLKEMDLSSIVYCAIQFYSMRT